MEHSQNTYNKLNVIWLITHQQAEAIFEFLENTDELLLWWRAGLCSEYILWNSDMESK